MTDLVVVIPSYGRPETVERTARAFEDTGAVGVPIVYACETNDPRLGDYRAAVEGRMPDRGRVMVGGWGAMAPAINGASRGALEWFDPYAIAVLNDDHVPRTAGWHESMVSALRSFSPAVGMVYPDDGYQGQRLSTVWAVTSTWVRTLGRMIPARVAHLYSDNAVLDLATEARCATYLPSVEITHRHPAAGHGEWTEGHLRVNSPAQYRADKRVFRVWLRSDRRVQQVRALREVIANG